MSDKKITFDINGKLISVPYQTAIRSELVKDRLDAIGLDYAIPIPRKYMVTSYIYTSFLNGKLLPVSSKELIISCYDLVSYVVDIEFFNYVMQQLLDNWSLLSYTIYNEINPDLQRDIFLHLPYQLIPQLHMKSYSFRNEWVNINNGKQITVNHVETYQTTVTYWNDNKQQQFCNTRTIVIPTTSGANHNSQMVQNNQNKHSSLLAWTNEEGGALEYTCEEVEFRDDPVTGRSQVCKKGLFNSQRQVAYYDNDDYQTGWTLLFHNGSSGWTNDTKYGGIFEKDVECEHYVKDASQDSWFNGLKRTYYPNGEIKCKKWYDDEMKLGMKNIWYQSVDGKNQQLESETQWTKNVVKHGPWKKWYPSGGIMEQGQHDNSRKCGMWITYYDDELHRVKDEGCYVRDGYIRDKKVGVWKHWDQNGTLVEEVTHE